MVFDQNAQLIPGSRMAWCDSMNMYKCTPWVLIKYDNKSLMNKIDFLVLGL